MFSGTASLTQSEVVSKRPEQRSRRLLPHVGRCRQLGNACGPSSCAVAVRAGLWPQEDAGQRLLLRGLARERLLRCALLLALLVLPGGSARPVAASSTRASLFGGTGLALPRGSGYSRVASPCGFSELCLGWAGPCYLCCCDSATDSWRSGGRGMLRTAVSHRGLVCAAFAEQPLPWLWVPGGFPACPRCGLLPSSGCQAPAGRSFPAAHPSRRLLRPRAASPFLGGEGSSRKALHWATLPSSHCVGASCALRVMWG